MSRNIQVAAFAVLLSVSSKEKILCYNVRGCFHSFSCAWHSINRSFLILYLSILPGNCSLIVSTFHLFKELSGSTLLN